MNEPGQKDGMDFDLRKISTNQLNLLKGILNQSQVGKPF